MLEVFLARLKQGHRTSAYPKEEPTLPDRFRGLPVIDASKCPEGCRDCAEACPTNAIAIDGPKVELDMGRCLFAPIAPMPVPRGRFATRPSTAWQRATATT